MKTYLKNLALKIGIELSDEQINKFFKFKNLLLETNKYMNLTAITNEKDIILKHFIDSLTINKYITSDSSLIDVGSGAGFPGIPIKIYRDDIKILLLDSLNKRVNFLNQAIDLIQLNDAKTIHGRAEDIAQMAEYREKFDFVTARAVANLSTLSELCLPFIKVGGKFICMKSNAEIEINDAKNAINTLGGKIISIDKINLPTIEDDYGIMNLKSIERTLIVIEKICITPKKYPRKAGMPVKQPIK